MRASCLVVLSPAIVIWAVTESVISLHFHLASQNEASLIQEHTLRGRLGCLASERLAPLRGSNP